MLGSASVAQELRLMKNAGDRSNQVTLELLMNRSLRMKRGISSEISLATKITDELIDVLKRLRLAWKEDPGSVPKGLSCSESKSGQFVVAAAESAFVILPGACVIRGIGAIELLGPEPAFESGFHSKTLVLKATQEGWLFSVKFVRPIVRARNAI